MFLYNHQFKQMHIPSVQPIDIAEQRFQFLTDTKRWPPTIYYTINRTFIFLCLSSFTEIFACNLLVYTVVGCLNGKTSKFTDFRYL